MRVKAAGCGSRSEHFDPRSSAAGFGRVALPFAVASRCQVNWQRIITKRTTKKEDAKTSGSISSQQNFKNNFVDLEERTGKRFLRRNKFEQKIGPLYAPNGPTLEFEVKGDRTNFIDLQNIFLEVMCKIVKADNTNINCDWRRNSARHASFRQQYSSLFSDCTVTAKGVKVSSANGLYAHKAFIETEFSQGKRIIAVVEK